MRIINVLKARLGSFKTLIVALRQAQAERILPFVVSLSNHERLILARPIRHILRNSSGFTLLETTVALGILSMGTGLIGTSVFQVLSIERYWQDDKVAAKDLRHVGSWFAGDALRAQTVTVGGSPTGSQVTITWNDASGTGHTSTYGITGDTLTRNMDGAINTLAEDVVSVNFSIDGRILLLVMTVDAGRGSTETMSLQTYMRVVQP